MTLSTYDHSGSQFYVKGFDGKQTCFNYDGTVHPILTDRDDQYMRDIYRDDAAPETQAFATEHRDLLLAYWDAFLLAMDLSDTLAVPAGDFVQEYFDKLPSNHEFNVYRRFVDDNRADLWWDLNDPDQTASRLEGARKIVAKAREMYPDYLMKHPMERAKALRDRLPEEYRKRIQPFFKVTMIVDGIVEGTDQNLGEYLDSLRGHVG